jgi:hypothetical protein
VEESGVTRDIVLRALRAAKEPHVKKTVTFSERSDWDVAIFNEDFATVQYIPPNPSRQTINRIARRFGIPKEWFYEPLTIPCDDPIQ